MNRDRSHKSSLPPFFIVILFVIALLVIVVPRTLQAELWVCPQRDGTEIYSNSDLGSPCRKLEPLRPLQRSPSEKTKPQTKDLPSKEPKALPEQELGGRDDPPSDSTITYSLLGKELKVQNLDQKWTAERVCIETVRTGVQGSLALGNDALCLDSLKPFEERTFTVVLGLKTEVKLGCVQWRRPQGKPIIGVPPLSAIQVTNPTAGENVFIVKNLDPNWTASRLCIHFLFHATHGESQWERDECVEGLTPFSQQPITINASFFGPIRVGTRVHCIEWTK